MYDAIVFDCTPQIAEERQAFICCHCGTVRPVSEWYNQEGGFKCSCGVSIVQVMCAPTGREGVVPEEISSLEDSMKLALLWKAANE